MLEKLQAASLLRVFFAHQSVGENVLTGLRTLAAENDVGLRIAEGRGAAPFVEPGIIHTQVGRNGDPLSKLTDFAGLLEEGAGDAAGVALMKLCYVDFTAETDAAALFAAYDKRHRELEARFPQTRFVPVTAPLTPVQRGLKAVLRNRIGTGAWGERENVRRGQYNALLRERFGQRIFDLAAVEAGDAGFERDGARWPSMRDDLTDDGGHLNGAGQRLAAIAFLDALLG